MTVRWALLVTMFAYKYTLSCLGFLGIVIVCIMTMKTGHPCRKIFRISVSPMFSEKVFNRFRK